MLRLYFIFEVFVMSDDAVKKSTLTICDRKILTLDGVDNVLGFDSGYVTLSTSLGKVGVEGEELKIESLTKDNGTVIITGSISGVFYSEEKASFGVFKGLFK